MDPLISIALAWAAYGGLHTGLASLRMKRWVTAHWPRLMPAYRLAYNLSASLLLLPVLWLTYSHPGEPLWHWPVWISWPVAGLVLAGYVWSLRWYDGSEFLGLRQWRNRHGNMHEGEALALSPLHRYVRHPWYFLGLVLLWTRDLNAAWLVTVLVLSAYLVVGSHLEDRKLEALYGDAYRRYRQRVPGLMPWPGRSLDKAEAEALQAMAIRERQRGDG